MKMPEQPVSPETLKPEIVWTPDLKVTADNWEELQEQGWMWDENRLIWGFGSMGEALTTLQIHQGIDNVLIGARFNEEQGRPMTQEEFKQLDGRMGNAGDDVVNAPRQGLYIRFNILDLEMKDLAFNSIANPYDRRRLDEARELLRGASPKWSKDTELLQEVEQNSIEQIEDSVQKQKAIELQKRINAARQMLDQRYAEKIAAEV